MNHYKIVNAKIIYETESLTAVFTYHDDTLVLEQIKPREKGEGRRGRQRGMKVR